ncbi:MAG: DNA-processing protein DprA, partial [Hyphomonas sp.]
LAPPPPILTLLGRASLAAQPTVAIVGARNASAAGRKLARDIAAGLGGAIDHVYPPQHERLYAEIAAEGLLVSESPFGYRAKAQDFPRRNRIITGIARGTVVVEAAERSGSLISARMAGEQGREVMAVPGSPLDPRAAGTNALLYQGASLVRHAADVIEILSSLRFGHVSSPETPPYDPESHDDPLPDSQVARVREALSPHPMPIDEIARASGLSAARCAAVLAELELSGEAVTLSGGLAVRAV